MMRRTSANPVTPEDAGTGTSCAADDWELGAPPKRRGPAWLQLASLLSRVGKQACLAWCEMAREEGEEREGEGERPGRART